MAVEEHCTRTDYVRNIVFHLQGAFAVLLLRKIAPLATIHAVALLNSGRNTSLLVILKRSLICLWVNLKRSTARSGPIETVHKVRGICK